MPVFRSAHSQIANLSLLHRKHLTAADHRERRGDAYTAWREVSLLINA
jgi:putative transposase